MSDDSAAIDAYFKPVADMLRAFAQRHNLANEKYPHGAVMCSLCFAHPSGGHAKLDLTDYSATEVKIAPVWWIDEYRRFARNLRWGDKVICRLEPAELEGVLERQLVLMLSWRPGDWTQVATGYEKSWGPYTEQQFAAMAPRWPVARP